MFFDDEDRKAREPFAVFNGHALFLVRVPHGVSIETNGEVIAECSPIVTDGFLNMLIDRALRGKGKTTSNIHRKGRRK
jgi:hypothetical protein